MASQSIRSWVKSARGGPVASRQRIDRKSLAALIVLVTLVVAASGWFAGLLLTPSKRYGEAPPAPTIADYRVGSIVFVPVNGRDCETYRFDNLTGGVALDAKVDCEKRLNPAESDAFAPGTERRSRMNSVLGGFRKPGE